jgi:hypothetical protein
VPYVTKILYVNDLWPTMFFNSKILCRTTEQEKSWPKQQQQHYQPNKYTVAFALFWVSYLQFVRILTAISSCSILLHGARLHCLPKSARFCQRTAYFTTHECCTKLLSANSAVLPLLPWQLWVSESCEKRGKSGMFGEDAYAQSVKWLTFPPKLSPDRITVDFG